MQKCSSAGYQVMLPPCLFLRIYACQVNLVLLCQTLGSSLYDTLMWCDAFFFSVELFISHQKVCRQRQAADKDDALSGTLSRLHTPRCSSRAPRQPHQASLPFEILRRRPPQASADLSPQTPRAAPAVSFEARHLRSSRVVSEITNKAQQRDGATREITSQVTCHQRAHEQIRWRCSECAAETDAFHHETEEKQSSGSRFQHSEESIEDRQVSPQKEYLCLCGGRQDFSQSLGSGQ